MAYQICVIGLFLSLHSVQSYILLTANLDDVHAIAKQIAESPVAGQLNQIIRRASDIFSEQVQKAINNSPQLRANDDEKEPVSVPGGKEVVDDFEVWSPENKEKGKGKAEALSSESDSSESSENNNKVNKVGRRRSDGLEELGKNASFYLKSIKKIFENLK